MARLHHSRFFSVGKILLKHPVYKKDWWEHVMEYNKEICSLLGNSNSSPTLIIEDPEVILKVFLYVYFLPRPWRAVGWLDVVVKLLCLHGSYLFDQIENGLVEAVDVLLSQMPRLRPDVSAKKMGVCYNTKSEFMKVAAKKNSSMNKKIST